ncbi:MFS transporter [Paenibacillus sp. J14]|uniref:MFS transporter n=1 Tax=Paenibacillus sp. (strain J14) TaxID=935845 RepID=UPI00048FE816|nr:MFS transporter [Paenibacillus sp. J14]
MRNTTTGPQSSGTPTSSEALQREGLLTVLLAIAVVLVIMNTAMFNLALPDVTKTFQLSATTTSLIVTGYSIMFAISSITFSRLSDFLPIRRLLAIGLTILGLAAITGMFSPNFWIVLAVRVVQASGAGAVVSLSLVTLSRYVPVERRGKAMAMNMSAVSLGLGLGPVVGGAIVEYFGWRYLFIITALTLILVPLFLRYIPKEQPVRGSFDTLGAIFVAVGTTGLLLYLTQHSLLALAIGAVALALFVWRIRTFADPFVSPALFRNGSYLALSIVGITSYLCSFATLFLLPQILVHQYELTASHAGMIIFPGSILAMVASRKIGSIIDHHGNGTILRYVPLLVLISMALFALFSGQSWLAILFIYILMSLGFTIISSSVSNEISRVLPASQVGSGMGLYQLLQFFSGAFSVAMASSAMEWQHDLPLSTAYSNIFWGLMVIALVSLVSSFVYLRKVTVKVRTQQSTSLEA